MTPTPTRNLGAQTIADFGEQWLRFDTHQGFYASVALLGDIFGPLLPLDAVRDARVAEIGAGTGRIVQMLLDAGASHAIALEPSRAFDVLRRNLTHNGDRVEYIQATGDRLPAQRDLDLVFALQACARTAEAHRTAAA